MTHRLLLLNSLLLLCWLSVVGSFAATHPVAAVKAPNSSLFMLTSDGTVLAMNLTMSSANVVAKFNSESSGIVSDLAYGVINGRPSLFIASSHSNGHAIVGAIQQFTTNGQIINTWYVGHVVNGLTFDSASQELYFSSGDSPEIYVIETNKKSSASYVAEVIGAGKLGSMAIDLAAHRLYVADTNQGLLYAMSFEDRHTHVIGQVSTPQALLIDDQNTTLFIADSGHHQIVSLSLLRKQQNLSLIIPRNSFKTPTGLAWGDVSHLIVADQDSGTVSLVSLPTGQILYSTQLP